MQGGSALALADLEAHFRVFYAAIYRRVYALVLARSTQTDLGTHKAIGKKPGRVWTNILFFLPEAQV